MNQSKTSIGTIPLYMPWFNAAEIMINKVKGSITDKEV